MRILGSLQYVVASALLAACGTGEYPIPAADGPLTLQLRYPADEPVWVTDSISVWGTTGSGKARLRIDGRSIRIEPNGGFATFVPMPPGDPPMLELEASKGDSVIRRSLPIIRARSASLRPAEPRPAARWIRLSRPPSDTVDAATQARPIYGRWTPGGALALPIPQGVRLQVDAETPEELRLRLARNIAVWVSRVDAAAAAPRLAAPVVGSPRLAQFATSSVIELSATESLAMAAEVVQTHLRWTLFDARAPITMPVRTDEGLVREVEVRDAGDGRVLVDVTLAASPLGWRTCWRDGHAVLEIRPMPPAGAGLRGLVVAMDAGHPPGGAIGPTGLTEDSVSLAVTLEAAERLRALGARPILTRRSADPVSLEARVQLAEAAGAQVFVSVHVNAPGDGRPPWSVDGTRVFWLRPSSQRLAKALETSVGAALHQVRAGTIQSDLAVLRPTWFPSALIEGTTLVLPAREAYLRSPAGIADYATGIVAGIRAWVEDPKLRSPGAVTPTPLDGPDGAPR
jgi:N-acetylmuramoyl-L-alanine amidase